MYYLLFCFVVAFVFWIHDQLVFRERGVGVMW